MPGMRFADRADAGRRLAEALQPTRDAQPLVLAIPRGGVVVGAEVARGLDAPLDVVVPRKVRAPGNPELGLGAVATGVRVLDDGLIARLGVGRGYLDEEIALELREIGRRERTYREDRPRATVDGRTAIVVDDGIATGGTAVAALRWTRAQGPSRVVLAVPVAPPQTLERLAREADDIVAIATPAPFVAVGEWYERFDQTTDAEVIRLLRGFARASA
jgi:putative phosphoribosyl transferase